MWPLGGNKPSVILCVSLWSQLAISQGRTWVFYLCICNGFSQVLIESRSGPRADRFLRHVVRMLSAQFPRESGPCSRVMSAMDKGPGRPNIKSDLHRAEIKKHPRIWEEFLTPERAIPNLFSLSIHRCTWRKKATVCSWLGGSMVTAGYTD